MTARGRQGIVMAMLLLLLPGTAVGQEHPDLNRAAAAWGEGDFDATLAAARAALTDTLSAAQIAEAWDWIARVQYTMGESDSVVAALQQFVAFAPEREFDPSEREPEFVALHQIALSRQLLVRGVSVDSVTFPAGRGDVQFRVQLSQPAMTTSTLSGPAGFVRDLGTKLVRSVEIVEWDGLSADGEPAPPGIYTFEVVAGDPNVALYEGSTRLELRRTEPTLDPHIDAIPGFEEAPEFESPPRNWQPLALAGLSVAVGTGAALMLESGAPGVSRRELIAIDVAALLTGLWWSLKQPPPQPVEANIRLNELIEDQIARENERIDQDNARRQQEVLLTVVPVAQEGS